MAMTWAHIALLCFALSCSIGLNGCSVDVPKHKYGFWQGKLNYLTKFQYYYQGLPAKKAILNSCSDRRIPPSMVCGGHGRCRSWNDLLPGQSPDLAGKLAAFCQCNKYWADPECRTPRKSQSVAYFLSLIFGFFGADQFYLGFWTYGATKLCSLGGLGLWYMYDVVRIGSYPVSTFDTFRVADDLPHYVFVVSSFSVMLSFGFAIGLAAINHERKTKAHELVLMRKDEEDVIDEDMDADLIRRLMNNARENEPLAVDKNGYGSTNDAGNIETLVRNAQGVDDAASNPQPAATSQVYSAPPGSMAVPSTLPPSSMPPAYAQTQPGSMAVPSTMSPGSIQTLSRSFRPAQTLPPQAVPTTLPSGRIQTLSPRVGTTSLPSQVPVQTLPPARVASAPIPSNSVRTEYSVPRAVMTVPMINTMDLTTTFSAAEPVD